MSIEKLFTWNRPPLAPKTVRFKSFAEMQKAPSFLSFYVVDVSLCRTCDDLTYWLGGNDLLGRINRLWTRDIRRQRRAIRLLEGRGVSTKRIRRGYRIFSIDQNTGAAL